MTRLRVRFTASLVVLAALMAAGMPSAQTSLATRVDAIVEAPIKDGKLAGASVAVVKGGQPLVIKAYGFADLELDVPTPPGATYEIGSVTKQFTAAAILLLAEQGKLSLDDELTKFLPDYPTTGHRVTIRRLLDHTSGIKGYTEMPEFREFQRLERPRHELVTLFSGQPFEFAPGEQQTYNNSAFFLLGLVIEKVAGTSSRPSSRRTCSRRWGCRLPTTAASVRFTRTTRTATTRRTDSSCSSPISIICGRTPRVRSARIPRIWSRGRARCTAGAY